MGKTPAGMAAWTTSTRLISTEQGSTRAIPSINAGMIPSRKRADQNRTPADRAGCN